MLFKTIEKNRYLIKIFRESLTDIDFYNLEEIKKLMTKIFTRLLKKETLSGLVFIDIYTDELYGIIMIIDNKNNYYYDDEIEVKINFHLDCSFLYEVEYFDIVNLNIKKQNIYYYEDKYYLHLIKEIKKETYLKLLEYSNIIYKDIDIIIEKGIRIGLN